MADTIWEDPDDSKWEKIFKFIGGLILLLQALVFCYFTLLMAAQIYLGTYSYVNRLDAVKRFWPLIVPLFPVIVGSVISYAMAIKPLINYLRFSPDRKTVRLIRIILLTAVLLIAIVSGAYIGNNRALAREAERSDMSSVFERVFGLKPPLNDFDRHKMEARVFEQIDESCRYIGLSFHDFEKKYGKLKGEIPQFNSIMQGISGHRKEMCRTSLYFGFKHPYCVQKEKSQRQAEEEKGWLYRLAEKFLR